MKRVLLTLLAVAIVLGVVAAAGFTGYRLGVAQSVQVTSNGDTLRPQPRVFGDFGPRGRDGFGLDHEFHRSFGPGGFLTRGFGFFFSPLRFLIQIAALGLIVWFAYWLFTRSGWQSTRTAQTVETQPKPTELEGKE